MKLRSAVVFMTAVFILGIFCAGQAKMRDYSYPYDISQLEWQLLNWTAAWRGTASLTEPFILDRLECDRNGWIVNVYVTGSAEQATDENLKKSVDKITKTFQGKFSEFVPETDLIVHYDLQAMDGTKAYKEYGAGSFKDGQSQTEENDMVTSMKIKAATSY